MQIIVGSTCVDIQVAFPRQGEWKEPMLWIDKAWLECLVFPPVTDGFSVHHLFFLNLFYLTDDRRQSALPHLLHSLRRLIECSGEQLKDDSLSYRKDPD